MLSVDEALELVLASAQPRPSALCPIGEAQRLVLDEDVASDVDSPPHDKSLVDGYAIRSVDVLSGQRVLEVLEEITAGAVPTRAVTVGASSRIMTGAPLPEGADAVVMVEQTEIVPSGATGERVQINSSKITSGQNIMRRASSMTRGQRVLERGRLLRSVEIGVLAEVGRAQVSVVPRPSVAVLSTGNELVRVDESPRAGQIRNSNSALLVAAAQAAGGSPVDLGIGRDEPSQLRELIARGLASDVLVISGGVSAGVLDLVPGVLAGLGVRQVFHKLSLKPGRPLWFGVAPDSAGDRLVFGLPGNPVSSFVCFELFVKPAIARLAGRRIESHETSAELTADFLHRGERPTYHPARLTERDGRRFVQPLRWQGSGDLRTLVDANALTCFPSGDRQWLTGESIRVVTL